MLGNAGQIVEKNEGQYQSHPTHWCKRTRIAKKMHLIAKFIIDKQSR